MDTIDRQAALDLVTEVCKGILDNSKCHYDSSLHEMVYEDNSEVRAILKCNKEIKAALRALSPEQPELLTDAEQRIFLAAMDSEKKKCKNMDEDYKDSANQCTISLSQVCKEIERKVKKALWS